MGQIQTPAPELDIGKALAEAVERNKRQPVTPESIARGKAILRQAAIDGRIELSRRIEAGEVVTAKAISAATGLSCLVLSRKERERMLFSIPGPSRIKYYPAFYGDARYSREQIEAVIHCLDAMPPEQKFDFFTQKKLSLRNCSPLEALEQGGFAKVMTTAAEHIAR